MSKMIVKRRKGSTAAKRRIGALATRPKTRLLQLFRKLKWTSGYDYKKGRFRD